jgi:hypothetical protein
MASSYVRRHLITALGLNAVPFLAWFVAEWSAGTTLLLYWLETLVGGLLVGCRIVLHRRRVAVQGHWDYQAPKGHAEPGGRRQIAGRSSYLQAFLIPTLAFSAAHGLFLAVVGFMMISKHRSPEAEVQWEGLLAGFASILFFQLVDFLMDLSGLDRQPFRWIEQLGQQSFGRMAVIHLTIMGGMALVMFTGADRDLFGVFIFLKTVLNCSAYVPQWKPETPPAWLSKVMDRAARPELKGTTFAEFCRQADAEEDERLARNENAWPVH